MHDVEILSTKEKAAVFQQSLCFKGLAPQICEEMAARAQSNHYAKGEMIFHANDRQRHFYIVAQGMVRVSICSLEGQRLTYLLPVEGEPLNIAGVFSNHPRPIEAQAIRDAVIMMLRQDDFMAFVFKYPPIVKAIITMLGNAVDSANSRILDMVGKSVEQRMQRILYTLYMKFGSTLRFTSSEIAGMIGTTTESSLRTLSKFRQQGLIETRRGQITILKPDAFTDHSWDRMWL